MLLNNLFHISASQQRDSKMPNANSSYPQTLVKSFSGLSVAAKLKVCLREILSLSTFCSFFVTEVLLCAGLQNREFAYIEI